MQCEKHNLGKEKLDMLDVIKFKTSPLPKTLLIKWKTEWEEIIAKHISDKGFISKKFLKFNDKKNLAKIIKIVKIDLKNSR